MPGRSQITTLLASAFALLQACATAPIIVAAGPTETCVSRDRLLACRGGLVSPHPLTPVLGRVSSPPLSQIALGSGLNCAITASDAQAWCWLVMGPARGESMVRVPLLDGARMIATGGVGCGLVNDDIACIDTLRDDSPYRRILPESAHFLRGVPPEQVVTLDVGRLGRVCIWTAEERAWCWEQTSRDGPEEAPLIHFSQATRQVVGLAEWPCAVRVDGRVECLCSGGGAVEIEDVVNPTHIDGGDYACALSGDEIRCWNHVLVQMACQVGQPTVAPTRIAGVGGIRFLTVGSEHACAVDHADRVLCWGSNERAQIDDVRRAYSHAVEPAFEPGPVPE